MYLHISLVDPDAAFHADADLDPYPFFHDNNLSILNPQAVLRIRDVYPGSRTLILIHPGSRIQQQQHKRKGNKSCPTFFGATNIIDLKTILFLNR